MRFYKSVWTTVSRSFRDKWPNFKQLPNFWGCIMCAFFTAGSGVTCKAKSEAIIQVSIHKLPTTRVYQKHSCPLQFYSFTYTSVGCHKTKSDKLQGYWSLQLASINHCDSITISAASVQMKAAAGALKRQHHKKESFCRRWPHRLAPYHPFTLTTQFATKQQGHHGLVAFIPALRVWIYAAVLSWMIRKSLHISAGTVQEQKSKIFSRKSDLPILFQHLLIYNLWIFELLCWCVIKTERVTQLCLKPVVAQKDSTFVMWEKTGEHKRAITPLDWFYATLTFWWSPHHCW